MPPLSRGGSRVVPGDYATRRLQDLIDRMQLPEHFFMLDRTGSICCPILHDRPPQVGAELSGGRRMLSAVYGNPAYFTAKD